MVFYGVKRKALPDGTGWSCALRGAAELAKTRPLRGGSQRLPARMQAVERLSGGAPRGARWNRVTRRDEKVEKSCFEGAKRFGP